MVKTFWMANLPASISFMGCTLASSAFCILPFSLFIYGNSIDLTGKRYASVEMIRS